MQSEPNLLDWLTFFAAAAAVVTTIWATRRGDRELLDAHLDWEWFGSGPTAELPFLYINNRSNHAVEIVELTWFSGAFLRKPDEGTALYNEDPGDVNFPYRVEAGSSRKIYLEETGAIRSLKRAKRWSETFGIVRRSSVWLRIKTIRGGVKWLGAERALPWRERPDWFTGES